MQQFTGAEYLKMDIAGRFGLDKENWDVRLNWFEENKHQLYSLVEKADEQAGFLAGILAYEKAKKGIPTGYTISLDATSSGIQILAALSGCIESAKTCNLVNTGNREDAYSIIYSAMNEALGSVGYAERKAVKNACMTALYASKAEPRKIFGKGSKELAQFYLTMPEKLPGAWALVEDLVNLWQPDAYKHCYTMPDGFDVVLKVVDKVEESVHLMGVEHKIIRNVYQPKPMEVSLGANITHSCDGLIVREMQRRCSYTPDVINGVMSISEEGMSTSRKKDKQLLRLLSLYKESKFMSARIFDYLDDMNAGHLSQSAKQEIKYLATGMLAHKPFDITTIHDCFQCLPNYGNYLRYHYAEIMAQIARSNLLSHIASQITGKYIYVNKKGDISNLILESEYAIC